jgi:hypothetical protein
LELGGDSGNGNQMSLQASDLIGAVLVLALTLAACAGLARSFGIRRRIGFLIAVWHSVFGLAFAGFVASTGGDAIAYFETASTGAFEPGFGTAAIMTITVFAVNGLGLPYLGASLMFNLFGSLGLVAFAGALREAAVTKGPMVRLGASLLPFIPSLSFWTGGIGKDAVVFLGVSLCLFASARLRRRYLLFAAGLAIAFIARPHIAAFLILALCAGLVLGFRMAAGSKAVLVAAGLASAWLIVPFVATYAGFADGFSLEALDAFVEGRQGVNLDGGSSIPLDQMSLPSKVFAYLYRPLFFDAHNVVALVGSLENAALLLLTLIGIAGLLRGGRAQTSNTWFLFVFAAGTALVFALTTANLGIAMRQKWMLLPALLVLLVALQKQRRSAPVSRTARHKKTEDKAGTAGATA